MLDIKLIRENPDLVKENLKRRKDPEKLKLLDQVLQLDSDWRKLKHEEDDLRKQRNITSQEINVAKKQGKNIKQILEKAKQIT